MTWALDEITYSISCNLSAQEFGYVQTYYTHVRLTHLPFSVPTITENRHAHPARQARRHRQHSQDLEMSGSQGSIKREGSRGAEGPRQLRRTASRTKQREGGVSGLASALTKTKGDGKVVEQKSLNKIMRKAILKTHQDDEGPLIHGVGHAADHGIEARGGQHAEADADLRRESETRGERTHTRSTIRVGILGLGQVSPSEAQRSGRENSTGHSDILGQTGTALSFADLRRGTLLQAGQNVQSRHQESDAEHCLPREAGSSFSKHSAKQSQSASTDGLHRQLWKESCKRSWKNC